MRTTAKIPHPKMDVSVYLKSDKYLLQIVLGQYEQVYRINATDVTGMEDVLKMANKDFLDLVYMRFVAMSKDLKSAFEQINIITNEQ